MNRSAESSSLARPWLSPGMRWIRRVAIGMFLAGLIFMVAAGVLRRSKKAALEQALKECGYCCEDRKGDSRPGPGRPSATASAGAAP